MIETFCNGEKSPWMSKPFTLDVDGVTWLCASDGYHMVGLRAETAIERKDLPAKLLELAPGYVRSAKSTATLDVDPELLSLCRVAGPCSDCSDTLRAKCRDCDGKGKTTCECSSCGNAHVGECQECEEGVVDCFLCFGVAQELIVVNGVGVNSYRLRRGLRFIPDGKLSTTVETIHGVEPGVALVTEDRFFILMPIRIGDEDAIVGRWPETRAVAS